MDMDMDRLGVPTDASPSVFAFRVFFPLRDAFPRLGDDVAFDRSFALDRMDSATPCSNNIIKRGNTMC